MGWAGAATKGREGLPGDRSTGIFHWDLLGSGGRCRAFSRPWPPVRRGKSTRKLVTAPPAGLHMAERFGKLAAAIRNPSTASPVAMTQQFAVPDDAPPHHPHYGDAFVVFAVTVLSCAVGAWLLLRLGAALWVGSVAALGVYAALLSLHLLVRRSLMPRAAAAAPVVSPRTRRPPAFADEPVLRPEPPAMPATAPKHQPLSQPAEPAHGVEPASSEKRRPEPLSQA